MRVRPDARSRYTYGLSAALVVIAVVAFASAAWFALRQPEVPALQQPGPLPGMRNAANLGFLGVFPPMGLVLVMAVVGSWKRGVVLAVGPFVALTSGAIVLNAVTLRAMIRESRTGRVPCPSAARSPAARPCIRPCTCTTSSGELHHGSQSWRSAPCWRL
jgi:hypothetical protein